MTVFDCLFSHTVTIYRQICALHDSWINQPRAVVHTIGVHYLTGSVISQSQAHRSTASRHVNFMDVIHYFLLNKTQQSQKTLPFFEPSWCHCWMMLIWINKCLNLIFLWFYFYYSINLSCNIFEFLFLDLTLCLSLERCNRKPNT